MAEHTTNYTSTFIGVAPDSPAPGPTVPPERETPTVARRTYELLADAPYRFTSDDIVFTVWADRNGIPEDERPAAREEFFAKGQPCLRSSDLAQKYGWGFHCDADGRVALYGKGSREYDSLVLGLDPRDSSHVKVMAAMRSAR